MDMNYDQLLFSELRLVSVKTNSGVSELSDELITKALTVNEELISDRKSVV